MTTTLSRNVYDISLVVGMLFLSLPTLGCFVVSDDISLIGKLFLSIPTWGCVDISNEFNLVGMLWLDRPKVRIFILNDWGEQRGSLQGPTTIYNEST